MTEPATFACRQLRFRGYRNFAELDLELPREGVAIVGDNGSGKTNLLEGLYYLEIFRSFRGAPDEQLIRFGAEAFHVRGRFEQAGTAAPKEVSAAYERRRRRKKVAVDGVECERMSDAIGQVGAVLFSPSDVGIVAGPPAERRRFLDIALSLNRPGYLPALQRYRHVLRQRNAMLRDGAAAELLAAWDDGLVEAGGRILAARARWVAECAAGFEARARRVGDTAIRMRYAPDVAIAGEEPPEPDAAADAFRAELLRRAPRERERGVTLTGPHRDDVAFVIGDGDAGIDLRDFGSGGQQRTAALALRMVEAEMVRRSRGGEPVVLLDDVFAELDPGRSRRILELLEEEERGQVVLTAPKASDIELRCGALPRWSIAHGRIRT